MVIPMAKIARQRLAITFHISVSPRSGASSSFATVSTMHSAATAGPTQPGLAPSASSTAKVYGTALATPSGRHRSTANTVATSASASAAGCVVASRRITRPPFGGGRLCAVGGQYRGPSARSVGGPRQGVRTRSNSISHEI